MYHIPEVEQLLAAHPKTKQQLLEWQKKGLRLFQTSALEADGEKEAVMPEVDDKMALQYATASFALNPRALYEFFDEEKVFVVILPPTEEKNKFSFKINGVESEQTFAARITAEQAAFYEAISITEKNLI